MHTTCACILKRNENILSHLTAITVNIKLNANINWTDITKLFEYSVLFLLIIFEFLV